MLRLLYLGGGFTALGLGIVGVFLPILPTVPFLLLAAFCFARSHPDLALRLYAHPTYGAPMRQWRDRRAISRRAKLSALAGMSLGVIFTALTIGWPWVLISIAVLVFAGSWIWTRAE